jgi:transcriptional regulator with XRE-family HTH domain
MIVRNKAGLRTDRLRATREQRGWSQRELARLCGLGEAQVNKYEKGHTDPSATYLKIMAETLGVSSDYLLGLSDMPNGQLGDALKSDERQLLDAYIANDNASLLEMITERMRHTERTG